MVDTMASSIALFHDYMQGLKLWVSCVQWVSCTQCWVSCKCCWVSC